MTINLTTTAIVLIVEDEPIIRMLAVDMVEQAGFAAIEARDADEAISILESRSDISIVFTDIDMPGSVNGMALAARVRDRWPPVEIIVTSGQFGFRDVALPTRGVFIPKPYRAKELAAMLNALT